MDAKVDDLFRWYMKVTIGDRQVWLRTLSATDESERVKASMRASRAMRAKLLVDSPEREDMLAAYKAIDKDELLAAIRVFRTEEAKALVNSEVQPEIDPPEPDGPTLDDAMDAEELWEEEMTKVAERRKAWIEEHVDTVMDLKHGEQSIDELRNTAIDMQISAFCTQAYLEEFNAQSVYRACYEDEKFTKRTFESAKQAGEISGRVFYYLIGQYRELDRFGLGTDLLKN
jgi:hypothetical protein